MSHLAAGLGLLAWLTDRVGPADRPNPCQHGLRRSDIAELDDQVVVSARGARIDWNCRWIDGKVKSSGFNREMSCYVPHVTS